MKHSEIMSTITEIVNNENIKKENLSLVYSLPHNEYIKTLEDFHYNTNNLNKEIEYVDEFEIIVGQIKILIRDESIN